MEPVTAAAAISAGASLLSGLFGVLSGAEAQRRQLAGQVETEKFKMGQQAAQLEQAGKQKAFEDLIGAYRSTLMGK